MATVSATARWRTVPRPIPATMASGQGEQAQQAQHDGTPSQGLEGAVVDLRALARQVRGWSWSGGFAHGRIGREVGQLQLGVDGPGQ